MCLFQVGFLFFSFSFIYLNIPPEEQLLVNAMDLFSAGSETTATTLAWAVCFMIIHPDVQKKVQQEIDQVLGDRTPTLDDRGRLRIHDSMEEYNIDYVF